MRRGWEVDVPMGVGQETDLDGSIVRRAMRWSHVRIGFASTSSGLWTLEMETCPELLRWPVTPRSSGAPSGAGGRCVSDVDVIGDALLAVQADGSRRQPTATH